ncbi:MAG: septum formation protein Maf [Candidatus Electrothrix sp. AS4_5]|jgi:septum formation protein|nr:septum formation protein Maf [Candidatus Electrothrix gigas]MCI5188744.1 septum formation protein Maf [Candidatus Electrothrix gigas]MCI5226082.1 septum formation protein Maf [Candidatus Electrothrix gigas]
MFTTCKPLILASASPRRQQFLADLSLTFTILVADIDETPLAGEKPAAFACRMAQEKAEAIAQQYPASWVIGADTVVTLEGRILGKPDSAGHALEMLRCLQGKKHEVITGVTLRCIEERCMENLSKRTEVRFAQCSDAILSAYIQTKEPLDKAGAYGIQGKGGFLVRSIVGSCSNVIGLPVNTCVRLLLHHQVIEPLQEKK